jgi:hypothetical protein
VDEASAKAILRDLKQGSGLTIANLRQRAAPLIAALEVESADEVRALIIDRLSNLDGTREGAALGNAFALGPSQRGASLTARRQRLAHMWGDVSEDTVERCERRGLDQLYLWLFPRPARPSGRDWPLQGGIDVAFAGDDAPSTHFRGDDWEIVIRGKGLQEPSVPAIGCFFGESLIDSQRELALYYLRPKEPGADATLQLQFGGQAVYVRFPLREGHGEGISTIVLRFFGPARPSTVTHAFVPDPDQFNDTFSTFDMGAGVGMTNGSWMALIYDDRPTTGKAIILRDFVASWDEPEIKDAIRTGALIPLFR